MACLIPKAQISIGKFELKFNNQKSLYVLLYLGGEILSVSDERGSAIPQQKVRIIHLQSELLT